TALSFASALSADAALALSVPPSAVTALASRMPMAGLVTIAGIAVFGVADVSTTVLGLGAVAVMPAIRKDGLPAMFLTRISEKTTSLAVTGSPLANLTPWRSVNVNVLASADAVNPVARSGTGLDTLLPL